MAADPDSSVTLWTGFFWMRTAKCPSAFAADRRQHHSNNLSRFNITLSRSRPPGFISNSQAVVPCEDVFDVKTQVGKFRRALPAIP